MGGSRTKHAGRPGPGRSRILARALRNTALVVLMALAACQAQSPAPTFSDSVARPPEVATLRSPHLRISHRHHVKAAWRRRAHVPKRRDVEAILAGMRRARAERHAPPQPANSSQ